MQDPGLTLQPMVYALPLPCGFCPLLKKSSGNPYLKMHDFSQHFTADAPLKNPNIYFYPISEHLWNTKHNDFLGFWDPCEVVLFSSHIKCWVSK